MNLAASVPITNDEQSMLWRQLFQHTPGGLVGLEAVRDSETNALIDLRYRFINEVALRDIFRRHPDQKHDVTGQLFSTYFPSIRQTPLWELYLNVLQTQQPCDAVGTYLFDGHNLRVEMSISPFKDGLLLSYNETSENHRQTEALRQQTERLTNVINDSPNAMIVFEAIRNAAGVPTDFRLSLVNRVFEVLIGKPGDYFIGKSLSEFYPVGPIQYAELVRLMDTGEPIQREKYIAEQAIWIDAVLTRLDNGFVVTLTDTTAEKKTLSQLEQQAQLLDGLMDTVQNGLAVIDAIRDNAGRPTDFRYVVASTSLLKGLNLPREKVVGQTLLSVLPGLRDTTLWPIYLRVLETGVSHQFENQYKADGFDEFFALSVAKLNDGLVISYTNITQSKLAQNQLESLVIDLRRSNESLDQFAYVASHDLQEPLRKIVSFGDLLQQQSSAQLSDSAIDLIRRMQQAASRMRILVQDLLTYSRLTTHPTQYVPVSLDQVVNNTLFELRDAIHEHRAELSITPLPTVPGDHLLLIQLFKNLIGNALKFHKANKPPRITITGQILTYPDALPTASRCAKIDIMDEGIGFDEKYTDRIFIVFQRLHSQSQYPGTGIGLAICKKVVELHNGTLTATSHPDANTTFTVWLPVA